MGVSPKLLNHVAIGEAPAWFSTLGFWSDRLPPEANWQGKRQERAEARGRAALERTKGNSGYFRPSLFRGASYLSIFRSVANFC
jgi:hypothetical protein